MTRTSTSETSNSTAFRKKLNSWYREHGRHTLPWRLTRDPYAVLVSEVMLQQTQAERVLFYYGAWLERWPGFGALAASPPAEAIRQWRGLGYNSRALNLHRLAVTVVALHKGDLPPDTAGLRQLPGIGPYTASAITCFARDERIVIADTNIRRVIARAVLGVPHPREVAPRTISAAAEILLPARSSRNHNLALMDLGAMVCLARNPACAACPVASSCRWKARGFPPGQANVKPMPAFETTARFARGRIIDALRESPAKTEELSAILPVRHRARLGDYLNALSREGMVVETDAHWSLPG